MKVKGLKKNQEIYLQQRVRHYFSECLFSDAIQWSYCSIHFSKEAEKSFTGNCFTEPGTSVIILESRLNEAYGGSSSTSKTGRNRMIRDVSYDFNIVFTIR